MIVLVDQDFKIVQGEFGFDLFKLVKGKRKGEGSITVPTGEEYQREDLVGYYSDLENVIKKIIHLRLSSKEETVTLKEYLEVYREQVDKIEKLLSQVTKL